jgi:hypothetical protein
VLEIASEELSPASSDEVVSVSEEPKSISSLNSGGLLEIKDTTLDVSLEVLSLLVLPVVGLQPANAHTTSITKEITRQVRSTVFLLKSEVKISTL